MNKSENAGVVDYQKTKTGKKEKNSKYDHVQSKSLWEIERMLKKKQKDQKTHEQSSRNFYFNYNF